MDYGKLKQKKEQVEQAKLTIPLEKILQKQREFEVQFAHNSTALAGNSLTDRKSTRQNSSHIRRSRMPSSA